MVTVSKGCRNTFEILSRGSIGDHVIDALLDFFLEGFVSVTARRGYNERNSCFGQVFIDGCFEEHPSEGPQSREDVCLTEERAVRCRFPQFLDL